MATNEVEIEVILEGAAKATKELKGIGQAGRSVAESMRTTNEKLGEGFTSVTDGVDSVVESIGGFNTAIKNAGTSGAAGLSSLLGPVALLTTGVVALYEAFRQFSGAAKQAEEQQEAMAAAAGDLQSKLEALAEKGVTPTAQALEEFSRATLKAQVAKERAQRAGEKLAKVYGEEEDAQIALNKAKEQAEKAERSRAKFTDKAVIGSRLNDRLINQQVQSTNNLEAAEKRLKEAKAARIKQEKELFRLTEIAGKQLQASAKLEENLEEQSKDSLKAKAKELSQKVKELELQTAEIDYKKDSVKQGQRKIDAEEDALNRSQAIEKENEKQLAERIKRLKAEIKSFEDYNTQDKFYTVQRKNLAEEKTKITRQETKKRILERKREAQALLTQQARIESLRIQLENEGFTERVKLATLAYQTELKLADDNADKKLEAQLRYQLKLKGIGQDILNDEQRRLNQEQKMIDDFLDKARKAQEEANKREREAQQEKINQTKADYNELINAVDHYSSGLANAAAAALLFGDSVSQGVADALNALASEAAVNALIETAKGISAAVLTPKLAAGHFAAAGQFAIAATAARGASAMLGGGGGGGGGVTSGASASPSGAPQTASAPIREEARESQIVYNINFGSSVIYDSKRAAEQALADRITTIQNTRRRGAPIPRRA